MKIAAVILIVAFLAVAGMAGAAPDAADALPNATFDIYFPGYCDGLHVIMDPAVGVAYGDFNSWCASCPYPDRWGGNVVYNLDPYTYGWGWTASLETLYGGQPPTAYMSLSTNPRNVQAYFFDGTVMNSFTWQICGMDAAQHQGDSPAFAR